MADDTPGQVAATLAEIRADIEETADVYNLDGAGKNSYPISAAMIRHARPLLAAVEAALKHHRRVPDQRGVADGPPRPPICEGCRIAWPCPEVAAITAALTGTQPSEEESDRG